MTTTALRALLVIALTAITVLLTASPALATDPPPVLVPPVAEPVDPNLTDPTLGEDNGESTGGYRCPDPTDVAPCDDGAVSTAPVQAPAPVQSSPRAVPAPRTSNAPHAVPAPGTRAQTPAAAAVPAQDQAPAAGAAAVPADPTPAFPVWVLRDKIMQWLSILFPWAFDRTA